METKDLYFAGTLMSLGHQIDGIDYRNGIAYFIFEENLDTLFQDYTNDKLLVSGKQLRNNVTHLKSVIANANAKATGK